MKIFKKIFLIIIFSFFFTPSFAKDPKELIKEITETASSILKENISIEEKAEKLTLIAETAVDIDGIGLYSLGKYRKTINNKDLDEYKIIFKK